MNYKRFWGAVSAALLIVIAILMLAVAAGAASKYKTIYKFKGNKRGGHPVAGVIFDQEGNLYGTTQAGGAYGDGVVFELTPNPDGSWKEEALYSFCALTKCSDGAYPRAGVIFDTAGNLYGTASEGGTNDCEFGTCGVVFKLTPNPDGSWTESVLHSFSDNGEGFFPDAGLVFDTAGNLYGTIGYANRLESGIVFELTPNLDGSWQEETLYRFGSGGKNDGSFPVAGLIFDTAGNLYGTTLKGGDFPTRCGGGGAGCGVVFKLTPNADGSWTESVLYGFTGSRNKDGGHPVAGLIFDTAGNLYGTTSSDGGAHKQGVVFKLMPNPDGSWTETVLHHFSGGKDGGVPDAGLIFDQAGNLYGTASVGGILSYCGGSGCGVVFKLTPNPDGSWKEEVLHRFNGRQAANPHAGLIFDAAGNLYGTTAGYLTAFGSVFEITP
jgi:uncharacterized repeat protein (TIGR03803 family)